MPWEISKQQNAKVFSLENKDFSNAKVFSSLKEIYWANSRDFERIREKYFPFHESFFRETCSKNRETGKFMP